MGVLLVMKKQINWQELDLNSRSQDLNQLAASQLELPRKRHRLDEQKSQQKKPWESVTGLREAKGLTLGPSARRTKDLLKLNRGQLRWVVGLFTRHCHIKGHLFKLGLADDPTCERCLEEDESATHILCDFEAIAYLRFRHLGLFFMKPSDYYDAPINEVLCFIRSVGLIKG
jgi:hypothetical protein